MRAFIKKIIPNDAIAPLAHKGWEFALAAGAAALSMALSGAGAASIDMLISRARARAGWGQDTPCQRLGLPCPEAGAGASDDGRQVAKGYSDAVES